MALKLPQQFGTYTLQELIARGGMAEIFRATTPGIGGFERTVAIKKILPHLSENEEFITMLVDEARIIVGLNHANIAQVYNLDLIDDTYYIAMEYVHGLDLSSILKELQKRNETIPVQHAIFITSGVCAGLHAAHNSCDASGRPLNIVHRDVSPHNVMLSYSGDVKIIDFGVAKARGREAHTKLGVIKGKLLYMAPEQAMAKEIDGRADLFAAGLILYKMLTFKLPFEGDNEFQIYNNIMSREIIPPREINPSVPQDLNHICMMLLQRDPDRRYQDGYAAKQDLDRALQAAAPGYTVNRLARFVEDNFAHLAQKRAQQRQDALSSPPGVGPQTPSIPPLGTDQLSARSLAGVGAMGGVAQGRDFGSGYPAEMELGGADSRPSAESLRAAILGDDPEPLGLGPETSVAEAIGAPTYEPPAFEAGLTTSPGLGAEGSFANLDVEQPPEAKIPLPRDERDPRALLIGGILLLVLAIVGMLVYGQFFRGATPASEGEAVEDTKPSDEVDKPNDEPDDEPKVAVAATPDSGTADAAAKSDAGAEADDVPMISVHFDSEPQGAELTVDGKDVGKTPLDVPIRADASEVEFKATAIGYLPAEGQFEPFAGQTKTIKLEAVEPTDDEPKAKEATPKANEEEPKAKPKPKPKTTPKPRKPRSKQKPKDDDSDFIPLGGDTKKKKKAPDVVNPFDFKGK